MNYNKLFVVVLFVCTLPGCLDSRNQRVKDNPLDLSLFKSDSPYKPNPLPGDDQSTSTATTQTTTSTTPPAHIAHCTWSSSGTSGFEFSSNHIGSYTLCQSTNAETDLYFQLKTNSGYNICFIPVNDSDGNVIYIGEPRCLLASDPLTVYKIVMLKNRPAVGYNTFSDLTMTGVMVMQDRAYEFPYPYYPYYNLANNPLRAPDAYLLCANWYQAGDTRYCQSFNSAGRYVYHKF
ncbi:MAG: hypothetical protein A2381_06640 [Bdellovibrionales bacterium RIFOXYB1_FULL_37_110]|nr:MAG: hypothetical protein A2181_08660 [Bdellovibrionales bacterium RIFOXYA1_FULL_38_20]OFZ50219.1 MAG: hypothetical protein A2417_19490 [Bdellovibrionales bacterium RIFOXYC1_FULL_37_79]OFZ57656.1 MAG: hypothetical protein A2381_06640 [Bdellovibrionales bacterium RIFOXYB1_FULL_37_110]OFZ61423.1 MAG: hypothetical protein A2577_01005 [Bdellovibrionales bacterium RIFOXYD1_FULL_36_51]